MKLISFRRDDGDGWGVLVGGGVADLSVRYPQWPTLKAAMAGGLLHQTPARSAEFTLDEVTLLPPVPDAGWIVCVGLNYRGHIAEMGRELPAKPTLFTRWTASVVGNGAAIVRPFESVAHDYEGELAVVIGRGGRRIAEGDAMDHVAGYSCFNDGSVRDFQRHTTQFTAGKNFDRSGAFGPAIVTTDEAPAWDAMELVTRLNGEEVQRGRLADLIFGVPSLIAYISSFTELQPGDVIATGTPDGVGAARTPPLWLKPGDRVEVEVSGVGVLANPVEAEA